MLFYVLVISWMRVLRCRWFPWLWFRTSKKQTARYGPCAAAAASRDAGSRQVMKALADQWVWATQEWLTVAGTCVAHPRQGVRTGQ
jgi:hypothetical protein